MAKWPIGEALEAFREVYGTGEKYRDYTESDEKRLAKRIPDIARTILKEDGWCSYNGQVFWLCDPDDWKEPVRAWFPKERSAVALARTAFGDLFVTSGSTFFQAYPHHSQMMPGTKDPGWFFGRTITAKTFMTVSEIPAKVRAARKAAGPLEWDEMYTYVPALALGGNEKKSKIERVKARERLVILSQLRSIDRR
jgi:hypothetical protein